MKALVLTLLLAFAYPANAHEIKVGDLVIVHPTVDEAEKGQATAQGSMEIRNEGVEDDRLLSLSAEFASNATFESSVDITIPPKGRVLVPVVYRNIKRKLSEDEAYAGELVFKRAGSFKIDILVHRHAHSLNMPIMGMITSPVDLAH
jgi:periplasmic copper chaperone A